jgi:hypothetical protein
LVKVLDDDTFSSQTMGSGFTGGDGKYAIDVNPKDVSKRDGEGWRAGQGCRGNLILWQQLAAIGSNWQQLAATGALSRPSTPASCSSLAS